MKSYLAEFVFPSLSLKCFIKEDTQITQQSCGAEMVAHWKGNIFQLRTPTHRTTLAKSIPSFVAPASSQAKADWIDFKCTIPLHTAGHPGICHIRHSSSRCLKSNGALLPTEGFCFYPGTRSALALMFSTSLFKVLAIH